MSDTTNDKPQRIEGDPEGYEVVFDVDVEISCLVCSVFNLPVCGCDRPPCLARERPDGRGVHYVKN